MRTGSGRLDVLNSPLVAAIIGLVGVILAAFIGVRFGYEKGVENNITTTNNTIATYIETAFVNSGLTDSSILNMEDPLEQMEEIKSAFDEKERQLQELSTAVQNVLVASGRDAAYISSCDTAKLAEELAQMGTRLQEAESAGEDMAAEISGLKSLPQVSLYTPNTIISGEPLNTPLQNYLATIDNHLYYAEDFLNLFLPESLQYEEGTIYYDKEAPERVSVIDGNLLYDINGWSILDGEHFSMGLHDYSSGIRTDNRSYMELKIACDKQYSRLVFRLGHVDNASTYNKNLIVYYMDDNGEFQEAFSTAMYNDMPVEDYSVNIYNTRTLKLVSVADDNAHGIYALTDIYLVR